MGSAETAERGGGQVSMPYIRAKAWVAAGQKSAEDLNSERRAQLERVADYCDRRGVTDGTVRDRPTADGGR